VGPIMDATRTGAVSAAAKVIKPSASARASVREMSFLMDMKINFLSLGFVLINLPASAGRLYYIPLPQKGEQKHELFI